MAKLFWAESSESLLLQTLDLLQHETVELIPQFTNAGPSHLHARVELLETTFSAGLLESGVSGREKSLVLYPRIAGPRLSHSGRIYFCGMIRSTHVLLYRKDPDANRAYFRDAMAIR